MTDSPDSQNTSGQLPVISAEEIITAVATAQPGKFRTAFLDAMGKQDSIHVLQNLLDRASIVDTTRPATQAAYALPLEETLAIAEKPKHENQGRIGNKIPLYSIPAIAIDAVKGAAVGEVIARFADGGTLTQVASIAVMAVITVAHSIDTQRGAINYAAEQSSDQIQAEIKDLHASIINTVTRTRDRLPTVNPRVKGDWTKLQDIERTNTAPLQRG